MVKKKAAGKAPGGGAKASGTKLPVKLGHSMDETKRGKGAAGGMRSVGTIKRLKMYKQRATRDSKGKVLKMDLQSRELPNTRIVPDRRWFGNTRVIGQAQLQQFREDVGAKVADPYSVLLKEKKLPLALLGSGYTNKERRGQLLGVQSFGETFGKGALRKRPKLQAEDYTALLQTAEEGETSYKDRQELVTLVRGADKDATSYASTDGVKDAAPEKAMLKGQSKRIWGELYKVVDSSDVVIQVLDARDPMGTRCRHLENHLKKNHRQKHMVLLLNKCDLVPAWVTKRWLHTLSRDYPTLAFHASLTGAFGKGALLSVLRQLARLKGEKSGITVGFVGYPNVGKSSVINTLRSKKVCKTAPMPGETKVWQYISLTKKINLVDCPGVVYHRNTDSDTSVVLKGVVRVGNLENAPDHIAEVLRRVKHVYLTRAYKIKDWTSDDDFLEKVARATGKLGKGGEPDVSTAAKMVLLDWQRGKIPFFELPPDHIERPKLADSKGPDDPSEDATFNKEQSVLMQAAESALALQKKRRMPAQHGFYTADDEKRPEGDEAMDGEAEEEDVDDVMDEDEDASDEEGEDGEKDGNESDDSDGYGAEGLSWDEVMKSMGTPIAADVVMPAAAPVAKATPKQTKKGKKGKEVVKEAVQEVVQEEEEEDVVPVAETTPKQSKRGQKQDYKKAEASAKKAAKVAEKAELAAEAEANPKQMKAGKNKNAEEVLAKRAAEAAKQAGVVSKKAEVVAKKAEVVVKKAEPVAETTPKQNKRRRTEKAEEVVKAPEPEPEPKAATPKQTKAGKNKKAEVAAKEPEPVPATTPKQTKGGKNKKAEAVVKEVAKEEKPVPATTPKQTKASKKKVEEAAKAAEPEPEATPTKQSKRVSNKKAEEVAKEAAKEGAKEVPKGKSPKAARGGGMKTPEAKTPAGGTRSSKRNRAGDEEEPKLPPAFVDTPRPPSATSKRKTRSPGGEEAAAAEKSTKRRR
eukprot:CAMPEP_0198213438 /NCGR_PEP_ID=MMETSP1445-20131203/28865_1 /TAXON_ID=36898 /ORGANISM="Pyramimonas sp., Strain CCMP2087" /LENGTH=972 /DNA_ID=CAMNT_0043888081 /DNA_START=246 /DNA_END=3167 /DNA_ORIENTATION=-